MDNIHVLEANPFNDHEQIESLKLALTETLDAPFGPLTEPVDEPKSDPSEEIPNSNHSQDDLFGFDDAETDSLDDEESFFYDEFDPFEYDFQQYQEQLESEEKAQKTKLDDLFKASTVRKMFRQLSKKLHPDLEQDESLKSRETSENDAPSGSKTKSRCTHYFHYAQCCFWLQHQQLYHR